MNSAKRKCRGFSLIELMVVIAIMAVLVAILSPMYIRYIEKGRKATCEHNMSEASGKYAIALTDAEAGSVAYTPQTLMDSVMEELQRTVVVSGSEYTGLCPSGGTTTMTVDDNGFVTLTCSKHGEDKSMLFAKKLVENIKTITRSTSGGTQYLYKWLKEGTSRAVDSEATEAAGADITFTEAIGNALGDYLPANQSWRLSYDPTAKEYVFYVTTGGKITKNDVGSTVTTIKYMFTESGKLESQTSVDVKVTLYKNSYPKLIP